MKNLSPIGAIHSPIDADRDVRAYATDFKALGLHGDNAFYILSLPKATPNTKTAPKKRGPKSAREKTIASLEDPRPSKFNVNIPSHEESDRTAAICNSPRKEVV